LILAGRSPAKVQECVDALRAKFDAPKYRLLQVDLSSQQSVRKAASEVMSWDDVPEIHLVINNAGVMNLPERILSPEGIEMHLATNHVGHFLLTNLIMPKLLAAAATKTTRIVNVSSIASYLSGLRAGDMNFERPTSALPEREKPNAAFLKGGGLAADEHLAYIPMAAYGHSKACNILFSVGLTRKLFARNILSVALHPGEVHSELHRTTDLEWLARVTKIRESQGFQVWKTASQAAGTVLVAALDPKLTKPDDTTGLSEGTAAAGHGYFLNDCRIGRAPPAAVDESDAARLWELSEAFVGEQFAW
jgi:NAD(P)-dependent dehydrogenase (short-subunit alcohol dehydrogenase family)